MALRTNNDGNQGVGLRHGAPQSHFHDGKTCHGIPAFFFIFPIRGDRPTQHEHDYASIVISFFAAHRNETTAR